jgi:hypothetical protein
MGSPGCHCAFFDQGQISDPDESATLSCTPSVASGAHCCLQPHDATSSIQIYYCGCLDLACSPDEVEVSDCRAATAAAANHESVSGTDGGSTPDAVSTPDGGMPTPCEAAVFRYQGALSVCFTNISAPSMSTINAACGLTTSAWQPCIDAVNTFTSCKTGRSCSDWITGCWSQFRSLDLCLGQRDPGASPPSDPSTAGFQGASTSCDSSTCQGEQTVCDSSGSCFTCSYSCSGSECAQTCDF